MVGCCLLVGCVWLLMLMFVVSLWGWLFWFCVLLFVVCLLSYFRHNSRFAIGALMLVVLLFCVLCGCLLVVAILLVYVCGLFGVCFDLGFCGSRVLCLIVLVLCGWLGWWVYMLMHSSLLLVLLYVRFAALC